MATRDQIERWLASAALGDRDAFAPLYAATSAKLFGLCLRVLGNRGEAEDALQDIYVKIWNGAGSYRANGLSPITWMAAVARNHCIDRLRARRRRAEDGAMPEEDRLADTGPGPEARAIAQGEARAVAGCLGELDPRRAEAVRRAYLEGETYAELAGRFDVPLNTMRTWLRRSLIALRACLERGT
ncbi:sigma-70 family RNA polymerase sigma factor [Jannaschia ovalis]|uniref:Sigma-70 family RNA polymerase sigma factor n=1 Tax=Jannaschia ovalis TaxID=3038773 RepID=A0ABY8LA61_9RHOB|nr:sigma-70 family RNA polymerase sigma factor [Jannaschia sp. GRR-S6-38]WGH78016.1 sigma-70 family RNA polymerase sigma factor [Jannaschia sp. GRR-S6-38]